MKKEIEKLCLDNKLQPWGYGVPNELQLEAIKFHLGLNKKRKIVSLNYGKNNIKKF